MGLASPAAPFASPSLPSAVLPLAPLPFFLARGFCAPFAAVAAASALALAFLSASYWFCFCFRPSLRRSSFFTARASSTANSMIGRLALLKTSGLLFRARSAARACSCSANSTKPMPLDLGLPSASGLVGSYRSLACRTLGLACVARFLTASRKIFLSSFWSTSGGTFRTCRRVLEMKKLGFLSLSACSSLARRRFMMSAWDTPCAAGPSSWI